jgi:phosphoribosylformylglycinamidine cyclo-ligase
VGELLLEEHRSYYGALAEPVSRGLVKGLAHITGGGLTDNVPRILPVGARARIRRGSWPVLPLFELIRKEGQVEEGEMFRVFNMGIGYILICRGADAARTLAALSGAGTRGTVIGSVVKGRRDVTVL